MKAIVVQKLSKLSVLEETSPESLEHLRETDPQAHAALHASEANQREANERVIRALRETGFETVVYTRDAFESVDADVDLVVAVGGDGTVLDVSHRVHTCPLVGINSDPERSVGYFCAGDAEQSARVFGDVREGKLRRTRLHRIALSVDGAPFAFPCMNDLLITNKNPAMMSRYAIATAERTEHHASSGIWISTPAGSTAGIRSAGGTVMPLEGALIQYLVREPYLTGTARYPLLRGVRHLHEGLRVRSLMEGGMIYVDGPWVQVPFPMGSELTLSEGPRLELLGVDPLRRER